VAAAWAASLARYPLGARASFLYSPHPQAVLLDLAVQAAGLVAVPLPEGLQGQQGLQGRVEIGGETVVLPSWEEAERAGAPAPGPERLAAGAVALRGEMVLSQEELGASAERLGREIPPLPGGRRHVVVLGGFPGDPAERRLLAWATVAGAAVLLEPEPAHYVPTAIWARPTVFAGTAADLVRLREAVERDEAGFKIFGRRIFGRRLPLGRLRAVLGTEGELPPGERSFWEESGVRAFAAERQERGI
jgi:hypothetical protein